MMMKNQIRLLLLIALVCSSQWIQQVKAEEEEEEADVPPPNSSSTNVVNNNNHRPLPTRNYVQPSTEVDVPISTVNGQDDVPSFPSEDEPVLIDSNSNKPSYNLPMPPIMKPKGYSRPYYEVPISSVYSQLKPQWTSNTRMTSSSGAGGSGSGSHQTQFKYQIPLKSGSSSSQTQTKIDLSPRQIKQQIQSNPQLSSSSWTSQNKIRDFGLVKPTNQQKLKPTQQQKKQQLSQISQKMMLMDSSPLSGYSSSSSYSYSEQYGPQWSSSSSSSSSQNQGRCPRSSLCPNRDAYLPHPNDCCAFIVCHDCVPHYMRCAANTQYNPFFRTCTYPYQSQCTAPNQDCHATANEYGSGNLKM